MTHQRIAIIGGTGFIGGRIAARLAARGVRVTLLSRHPARCPAALSLLPLVDLVSGEMGDPARLGSVLAGHDAVISMAGILHGSVKTFDHVHHRLVATIVAACQERGIRRLIHIGALGAAPDAPSHYLRSKAAGEAQVTGSGLDWTVLRPSVVFGRGDRFLNLFADLARTLPVLPLAGAGTRFQPVWVDDVARAAEQVIDNRRSVGVTLDLVGPREYTLAELVAYVGDLTGHPRPILPLPAGLAMLQAAVMECLPGVPLMSRDNVRSLAVDNISRQGFPAELLGFAPRAVESVAPDYLGTREVNQRRARWRTRAGRAQ
ncbi:complex I NDUFA9 subunit family protein [Paludibacterium paludis]|uniref:Complex I NDUFA9 subunit family protein n=1 Tax=Paludibacterium paludis TaxID=1225769 RepID=A0A918UBW1_9NEIS|nr:complex I NDUFA9 subunit family protein [Paludibacterium paludis]GGY25469.1 complex I NDUFA9 subunit family protein [Paludibacterium paludis]